MTLIPEEQLAEIKWTSTTITSCWVTINQDAAKFCGIFMQVTSVKKSGYTDAQDALEAFKKAEGKGKKQGKDLAFEVVSTS